MTILIAIFGWVLKLLTGGALGGLLTYFNNKERIKLGFVGRAFSSAVEAEIGIRQSVATERAALYAVSPFNRFVAGILTLLIVLPPAAHAAAVYADTLFTFIDWRIPKAPPPYDTAEGVICMGYIGVTTIGASIVAAASRVLRGK